MAPRLKFKKIVENKIKSFNSKQLGLFCWISAVRALPFMVVGSLREHYDYATAPNSMYQILYCLDFMYYSKDNMQDYEYLYKKRPNSTSDSFKGEINDFYMHCMNSAILALTAQNIDTARFLASEAADYSYIVAACCSEYIISNKMTTEKVTNFKLGFANVLYDDIKNIKNKTPLNPHIDIYGEIWNSFYEILRYKNYAYWAMLYKKIFENGFILNGEECFRRLNIPMEVQSQGAIFVENYLIELEREGVEYLDEARIIILGEKGAGKTCLARKLQNPKAPMTEDSESTIGVDTVVWKIKKKEINAASDINVHIWDFAGHTITHAVHKFFLSERCLYILVYDSRSEDRNRLQYWLNHMKNYGGNSIAFILVNLRDPHTPSIPINNLKEHFNIDDTVTYISIKNDNDKLVSFREKVKLYLKNHPSWNNQEIPAKYFRVKKILEAKFKSGKEDITKKEFYTIAQQNQIDKPEELLMNLHILGICLHYQDLKEFNTLVLNPEWISTAVYKVMNWVNEKRKFFLSLNEFGEVFSGKDAQRFPTEKHLFLFQLMKYYEIAYEGKNKKLVIPYLLPIDRPMHLPDFPDNKSLIIHYISDIELLPDTISRFIVRHNEEIKSSNKLPAWRFGVILEDDNGNIAMVREEDRTVSLSVTGSDPRARRLYFDKLRRTLNNLFEEYKILKPTLYYRIVDNIQNNSLWLQESAIMGYYRHDRNYFDPLTGEEFNLRPHIFNFKIINSNLNNTVLNIDSNIVNFQDCTLSLQGDFNELVDIFKQNGATKEAEEISEIANMLEDKGKNIKQKDLTKKNVPNKIKRIINEILNEDSKTNKIIKKTKYGFEIVKNIIKEYNKMANQFGFSPIEILLQ